MSAGMHIAAIATASAAPFTCAGQVANVRALSSSRSGHEKTAVARCAGFDVVGVDLNPQPRYPFEFHQADAMTFPLDDFDAIAASPPCQAYTDLRRVNPERDYPMLIAPIRERLIASRGPYVIENVVGARHHLKSPILLCGSTMGLPMIRRHRLFESNLVLFQQHCDHRASTARFPALNGRDRAAGRMSSICGVYGNGGDKRADLWPEAMGIDWMTRQELTQAIPPAYTEWIGRQLIAALPLARTGVAV